MTNEQLYLAIGVPVLLNIAVNALIYLALSNRIESKIDGLSKIMDVRFEAVNTRITALEVTMNARFDAAHQNLLRVEQVFDARLKHLEEES